LREKVDEKGLVQWWLIIGTTLFSGGRMVFSHGAICEKNSITQDDTFYLNQNRNAKRASL
jgi:hypothetical protein